MLSTCIVASSGRVELTHHHGHRPQRSTAGVLLMLRVAAICASAVSFHATATATRIAIASHHSSVTAHPIPSAWHVRLAHRASTRADAFCCDAMYDQPHAC